jgi:hypothetical protein
MPDKKWSWPDGESVTLHEDGSVTVKDANGAKTHYDPKPPKGERTETPAGAGQPNPPVEGSKPVETTPDEIKITFLDGTRVYIKLKDGKPVRVRIVRSNGAPRKWEADLENGQRVVEPTKGAKEVTTPPTSPTPESIEPSEHPKKDDEGSKKSKSSKKKARRGKAPAKSRRRPRRK